VRRTGGLADTVVDTNQETLDAGSATGFVFDREDSWVLGETMSRACSLFRRDPKTWKQVQQRGMRQDFSWEASAQKYLLMYQGILQ
jgi:starch synthase